MVNGLVPPPVVTFEEAKTVEKVQQEYFQFFSDLGVFDIGGWTSYERVVPAESYSRNPGCRMSDNRTHLPCPVQRFSKFYGKLRISCELSSVEPKLCHARLTDGPFLRGLDLDFTNVVLGDEVSIRFETSLGWEMAKQMADKVRVNLIVPTHTRLLVIWMTRP